MEKITKIPLSVILKDLFTNFFSIQNEKVLKLVDKIGEELDKNVELVSRYDVRPSTQGYVVLLQIPGQQGFEFSIPDFSFFKIYIDLDTSPANLEELAFYISNQKEEKQKQYVELSNLSIALRFQNDVLKPIDGSEYAEIRYGGLLRIYTDFTLLFVDTLGLTLTPCEFGNTGLILGFKGLRIDASSTKNIAPIADIGFDEAFKGVFFEEVTIATQKDRFFEGFPELEFNLMNAAFGTNGVTFKGKSFFPVVLEEDNNTISEATFLKGHLLFKDWQFAFEAIHLDVLKDKVEGFSLLGYIKIPILKLLMNVHFSLSNIGEHQATINYTVGKSSTELLEVINLASFFKLKIQSLRLSGVVENNRNFLNGKYTGEISFADFDIQLEEAAIQILKEEKLEHLIISITAFSFNDVDLIEDATFNHKLYKDENATENEGWKEETYIEASHKFEDLREKLNLDTLPDNFPSLPSGYEVYFKLFWNDLKKEFTFKISVDDVDYLWAFIPEKFRPEIKVAAYEFNKISEKKDSTYEVVSENFTLESDISLTPLLKHIPYNKFIQINTGNDDGCIHVSLKNNNVVEGKNVNTSNLQISNPIAISIDIPGINLEGPPIQTSVESITIDKSDKKKEKLELKGLLNVNPTVKFEKKISLFAKIEIKDLPFAIGVSDSAKENENDIYFTVGNIDLEEVKEFIDILLSPKGMDDFLKESFGGKDVKIVDQLKLQQIKKLEEDAKNKEDKEVVSSKVLHKDKGVFKIKKVDFKIPPVKELLKEGAFILNFTIDINSKLGPFYSSINGVGFKTLLSKGTNLNVISIDFKPIFPKEIGLAIKTKLINGGGVIYFDPDNHRYAGILALQLKAIDITAVGLINTRLPNNKKGFSMLLSISTLFRPPIQLSFGFTLNGVGGLIGVNRTMKVDELRRRLASGAIESIMFPKNVIENADRILSDLRAVFPSKDKHFVVAPFLRIGWGTTAIIEADLGILLEFPFKNRIILIGGLGIYLPTKDLPLTQIRIDVLGDFNFAEEYIRLEGVIRDSHVVGIPLSGGFAFVLSWDRRPQFLLSVGGYHPRYKRPARFPEIARLQAVIKYGKKFSLTCQYYQAITSNSFQIGFRADLWAKAMGAKITGYFGFNALLQFDPFYFETDVSMGVHVKYKRWKLAGVDLYFMLSGPKPWKIKGHAKIKVAIFKVKIKFKHTWGKKQKVAPSVIRPSKLLTQLQTQLEESRSWSSKLPSRFKPAALLRKIDKEKGSLLLHPSGYLEVRQTVVPLNRTIQKHGNSLVADKPKFQITNIKFGSKLYKDSKKSLKEYFAVGQFKDLTDAQKISSPDFELMDAGLGFEGVDDFDFGNLTMHDVSSDYEEFSLFKEEDVAARSSNETANTRSWNSNRMTIHKSSRGRRFREEEGFLLEEPIWYDDTEQYLIVHKMDFSLPKNEPFNSKMAANNYLENELASNTNDYEIMSLSDFEMITQEENEPIVYY